MLARLNLFIEIYWLAIKGLKSGKLLAPFLILAIFKSIALAALVYFYLPPIYRIMAPLLKLFYTDDILHYPQFYLIMPQINEFIAAYIIEPVFGVLLAGAAIFVIGTKIKNEKGGLGEGLRTAIKSAPALYAIWVIKTLLMVLAFKFGGAFLYPVIQGFSHGDFAAYFSIQMLALVMTSLLIYAPVAIMMHRRGIFESLTRSLKIAFRGLIFTFFLLFVPWVIKFPISYLLASKVYLILGKFNTTVLTYLLSADLLVSTIASFLTYTSVTYYYLSRTE